MLLLIVLLYLQWIPTFQSSYVTPSPLTLGGAPCSQKKIITKNKKQICTSTHTNKNKRINKFCIALPLVPTGQRTCACLCECLHVSCMCMEKCWLLLQALVEVDGGGLGTDLSNPLLQICLEPAQTHGAFLWEQGAAQGSCKHQTQADESHLDWSVQNWEPLHESSLLQSIHYNRRNGHCWYGHADPRHHHLHDGLLGGIRGLS